MPFPDLLSAFRQIAATSAAQESCLRLFNVYLGVPISYPAAILECGSNAIRIRTEKYQIACLYRERETYLQSSLLPAVLKARVVALDLPRLTAVLAGFRPVSSRIGSRTQVRVQPHHAISGSIRAQGSPQSCTGELADVSNDGLGIYLSKRYFLPDQYSLGQEVSVSFHLPGDYALPEAGSRMTPGTVPDPISRFDRATLRLRAASGPASRSYPENVSSRRSVRSPRVVVHGLIANTLEEPFYSHVRIGIRIHPGDPSRPVIVQFIARRQSDILRELKEISSLFS